MPKSVRAGSSPSIAPTPESGSDSAMTSGSCQLRKRNQSTVTTHSVGEPERQRRTGRRLGRLRRLAAQREGHAGRQQRRRDSARPRASRRRWDSPVDQVGVEVRGGLATLRSSVSRPWCRRHSAGDLHVGHAGERAQADQRAAALPARASAARSSPTSASWSGFCAMIARSGHVLHAEVRPPVSRQAARRIRSRTCRVVTPRLRAHVHVQDAAVLVARRGARHGEHRRPRRDPRAPTPSPPEMPPSGRVSVAPPGA